MTPTIEQKPNSAPPALDSLADTGLRQSLVEQILIRILHFRGEVTAKELSAALGLKFSLINEVIQVLKQHNVLQVRRSMGMGEISAVLTLTEAGRQRARECLELSQYAAALPVPASQYAEAVRAQRRPDGWLKREALQRALRHMVLSPVVMSQLAPAVSSGQSFLIYGSPGNGKTYLAEALGDIDGDPVYVPHAVEYQGNIVQVFDPALHTALPDEPTSALAFEEPGHDQRWVRCKRPFIASGGELTLDMLEMSYNAASRTYDAPLQMKANNGVYLIDDFGRQRASPAEVLNRWIVPSTLR